MPVYITVIMFLIIMALAAYALSLCLQLLKQKRQQARQLEQQKRMQEQRAQGKPVEAQASIEILLRCLLQNQVSLTEAAIRVSGLAKALKGSEVEQSFYAPFDALALATSHIPILDAWAKLSAKQKRAFEIERASIESEHRDSIVNAANQLLKPQ